MNPDTFYPCGLTPVVYQAQPHCYRCRVTIFGSTCPTRLASPFSLSRALGTLPDLEVCVVPVAVAPARLVGAAAVRGALVAVAVGAGRTVVVPDGEVILAKEWPGGRVDVLVGGVAPGDGFVALGLAGAQPVEVVAAGGVVAAVGAALSRGTAAVIPLDSAAPFLGPAPLRLGTKAAAA